MKKKAEITFNNKKEKMGNFFALMFDHNDNNIKDSYIHGFRIGLYKLIEAKLGITINTNKTTKIYQNKDKTGCDTLYIYSDTDNKEVYGIQNYYFGVDQSTGKYKLDPHISICPYDKTKVFNVDVKSPIKLNNKENVYFSVMGPSGVKTCI